MPPKKVQDANQYTGYSVKRRAGERTVVAQVVEIDGVEQSRTILSETCYCEPAHSPDCRLQEYNANIVAGDLSPPVNFGRFRRQLVTTKFGPGGHR